MGVEGNPRGRARRGRARAAEMPGRVTDYRRLTNPFRPQSVFSEDRVAAIHDTALRVLEELGIKVLLPEACKRFMAAGALVDEATGMVRIGREIVEAALAAAPARIHARAPAESRDIVYEEGALTFMSGAGAPNVSDRVNGRRPASLADFSAIARISQHFDVMHTMTASVEPQDVPVHLRHYAMTKVQVETSDKLPFVYARGTPQVLEGFEMLCLARGLDEDAFRAEPHTYTVINTNSPRQLDVPMAQGIIDFAEWGQVSIITPFCLAGAMAPITIAGALTLQHAEALAGIVLAQIVRPGAPVIYGSFASSVDMKSGAPAFGTPEHFQSALGAGQLARHIGLPWRGGGGTASNAVDAQAANETQMAMWGAVLGGCNMLVHAAGWIEGGLAVSLEKMIVDIEVLQMVAELCHPAPEDDDAIGFDAIAEVQPGGHFFSAAHTMDRYRTAFYEPLVADWSNFGNWTAAGSQTAPERATAIWRSIVEGFRPPASAAALEGVLDDYIARRSEAGGAEPVS
ncbi:MAG: trimethylamine methyltransferase family protein [Pseudomonadota bacterium]|nr:trimethylamine methyltransferase family protein [Pseudomonadota bacterium]